MVKAERPSEGASYDLLARLRSMSEGGWLEAGPVMAEAADEIERLRTENESKQERITELERFLRSTAGY